MKILLGIKRVVDYAAKVRVLPDKSAVDLGSVKMSLNPFCEIAIEEAVRLKEKKFAKEIVAVSIGPKVNQEALRTALAMGVDRAIHINSDLRGDQELQPLAVAKIFKAVALKEKADLILLGKQSIDGDNCQTGPMVAGLLGWPQCTFASSVAIADGTVTVDRETDTGSEQLSFPLPAVITADLRLNEPRYATLPNIMKAKKKPIESLTVEELKVDVAPRNKVLKVEDPPVRAAGSIVDSVDTLVDKLKNVAKVLK
jgi:electron transfer flavoprotein beta subunit